GRGGADGSRKRPRDPDLGLFQRIGGMLALEDRGSEEGNEQRSRGLHTLAASLDHVAHLVDKDHRYQSGRRPWADDGPVQAEAQKQREQCLEDAELEQNGSSGGQTPQHPTAGPGSSLTRRRLRREVVLEGLAPRRVLRRLRGWRWRIERWTRTHVCTEHTHARTARTSDPRWSAGLADPVVRRLDAPCGREAG